MQIESSRKSEMPKIAPILHMFYGKIASGKSTHAAMLLNAPGKVVMSEDAWLGALFADQMSTGADYLHYSSKLQKAFEPHVGALLHAGT